MPPIPLVKPLLVVLINHSHIHTGRISTQSHQLVSREPSLRCNSDGCCTLTPLPGGPWALRMRRVQEKNPLPQH